MAEVAPKTPETTPEVPPFELPHLKVIDRVKELPIVEIALIKSAETYYKVKDSNALVNWALTTAETSLNTAKKQAIPIAAPIAKKLESPIGFVDNTLCFGLDKIEEKVPLVKEQPAQILEKAVSRISYVNDLIIAQATNLRDLSWSTANHLLDTPYGIIAVKGVENTALIVDKLIDKYFPPIEEEKPSNNEEESKSDEGDKLLHTLQTVGLLSNKAARRVYTNVIHQLNTLKESSLTTYVNNLVEFLHLTKYLHTVNEKTEKKEEVHVNGERKEEPSNEKKEDTREENNIKEDTEKEKSE